MVTEDASDGGQKVKRGKREKKVVLLDQRPDDKLDYKVQGILNDSSMLYTR